MPEINELQRLITAAWSAGYATRETELVCRRRSSPAQRQAEIARLVEQIVAASAPRMPEASQQHEASLSI